MTLTLSVRSFQVPATPGTCAWPPSLPSVPTSRATRVTSAAKALSWSTIVLMVFFSSRISPFTSTVILRDRSPRATAVVTSAMLRTCVVRLAASRLTLSVRSFQVPATPGHDGLAAEPAFGADLARHARHLGGERAQLLDHRVERLLEQQDLAAHVDGDLLATGRRWRWRSPPRRCCAPAPVRLLAMKLTLSVRSFQVPATPGTCAWPPSLPSVPTSRATRVTSAANALSWSTIVLMVFFSSRISPFTSTVILRDRSPRATAVVTSAMLRTWRSGCRPSS